MNFNVPKKIPRFLIMVLGVFLMSLSCEAMQPYGGMGGGMPSGGPPKCCAAAFKGNPAGCQSCCQRKWQTNAMKKQRCFTNCQKGTCRRG